MQAPYWTLELTYDFRQLLEWSLRTDCPVDDDLRTKLDDAIANRATLLQLAAWEIDALDLLAAEADIHKPTFRVTVGNLLRALNALKKAKPSGHTTTVDAVVVPPAKQGSLFD